MQRTQQIDLEAAAALRGVCVIDAAGLMTPAELTSLSGRPQRAHAARYDRSRGGFVRDVTRQRRRFAAGADSIRSTNACGRSRRLAHTETVAPAAASDGRCLADARGRTRNQRHATRQWLSNAVTGDRVAA
jgi:hypothetical protein